MEKLVIYGAGGLAQELTWYIERINEEKPKFELLGYIVDEAYYKPNVAMMGYPLLGTVEWLMQHKDVSCVCAIADVHARRRILDNLQAEGINLPTIIAPNCTMHKSIKIGKGCVIAPDCTMTVNVTLGDGVFFNGAVRVGHDSTIGNYTTVFSSSNISGNCQIGDEVTIGGKTFIIPHRKIGNNAVIAAGSVVFTNVRSGITVMGNPAKRIKAIED